MKWITSGWLTQELAGPDSFLRSFVQQLLPVCDNGDRFRSRFREHCDDDELLAVRHRGPAVSVNVSTAAVDGCGKQGHGSAEALESGGGGHRHGHYFCIRGYVK